tara:strand:+ start:273 stop:1136 length:864 start_codon:yes stop_codon:yes gene_type:complete
MIPKIIIQTGKDNNHNDAVLAAIQSWKDLNPEYEYKYFTDKDCDEFILQNFHKDVRLAFNLLKPGAMKADLFRYCYLFIKGGVYTDLDNICIRPIDEWMNCEKEEFVTMLDLAYLEERSKESNDLLPKVKHDLIYQAFIASKPDNPILKKCIDHIVINTLNRVMPDDGLAPWWSPQYCGATIKLTGPKLLADIINQHIGMPVTSSFKLGLIKTDKVYIRFAGQLRNINMTSSNENNMWNQMQTITDLQGQSIIDVKYVGYEPGEDTYHLAKFPNEIYNYRLKLKDLK